MTNLCDKFPAQCQVIALSCSENLNWKDVRVLSNNRSITIQTQSQNLNVVHRYLMALTLHEQIGYLVCITKSITTKGIVFSEKHHIDPLNALLRKEGVNVSIIHADMSIDARRQNMMTFITGGTRLLVASDACSRGIGLIDVDLVINFNLPQQHSVFLSRSTRVGRNGRVGASVSLIDENQKNLPTKFARWANIELNQI